MKCHQILAAFCVFVQGEVWADNPDFTFWLRGAFGELIEGVAGSQLDDGTGGVSDFKNNRPGVTLEVLLTQGSIVHQFWETYGWQWALGVEGPLEITDVTLRGTVSCHPRDPPPDGGSQCLGGMGGVYSETELTGLPYGSGPQTLENHGALSLIGLGFQFASLPGFGDYVVAKIRVTGRFPEIEGDTVPGRVFFTSRIGSSAVPLSPAVAYLDFGLVTPTRGCPPLVLGDFALSLKAVPPIDNFIRCDTTNDGKLDIADPVRLLNQLFLGEGAPIRCPVSADCNGDDKRDLSDAIYGLSYLFLGTAPPPAPYPDCARPEGTTAEDCPGGSTRCP